MRLSKLFIAVVACAMAAAAVEPAQADGVDRHRHRVVHRPALTHWRSGSYVHVVNIYGYPALSADPFAYSYEPRPWYPYYNSGQWVPRAYMRYRTRYDFALPNYYSSWGYPLPCGPRTAYLCANPGDRRW